MIPKKFLYAAAIVFILASIALKVRIFLYPEVSWKIQLLLFAISLVVIGAYFSGFYLINLIWSKKLPFSKSIPLRVFAQVATGFIYVIIIRSAMIYYLGDYVPFTLTKFFTATIFLLDFFVSVAINSGFFAVHFFSEWKHSLIRAQQLEKEKMQVQYDSLKNQLNPHFLFNALTSLNSLIFDNQELASQYLKHLSKLYRYLLENKEVVSLEKELIFLENYLFILRTRFGKSLRILIEIREEDKSAQIVPVTLQNLIENAIKHNVANSDFPLTIKVYSDGDFIFIENNLHKKKIVENSNKQGLENLKMLYKYLSDKEVVVKDVDDKFVVKIPLIS